MTADVGRILRKIQGGAVARALLAETLELADREGILTRVQRLSPFSLPVLCRVLQAELGYNCGAGNRQRMIGLLLCLLAEYGWVRGTEGAWHWARDGARPAAEGEALGKLPEDAAARTDDQYLFLRKCLEAVPHYLRGERPAVTFDDRHAGAWESFLGCQEFRVCRALLLELMGVEDRPTFGVLDLCHGPGWGLEAAISQFPSIAVTALDFTSAFRSRACARVEAAQARNRLLGRPVTPVAWVGPERWKGFGHPLPFLDSSFEAVLFTCGDPYVPPSLRPAFYGEIARVLAPTGRLGILTRCSPDAARRYVRSCWLRMAALVHDFAESVCEGWEGFPGAEEHMGTLSEAGFQGGISPGSAMSVLESSLWVLKKRHADD